MRESKINISVVISPDEIEVAVTISSEVVVVAKNGVRGD